MLGQSQPYRLDRNRADSSPAPAVLLGEGKEARGGDEVTEGARRPSPVAQAADQEGDASHASRVLHQSEEVLCGPSVKARCGSTGKALADDLLDEVRSVVAHRAAPWGFGAGPICSGVELGQGVEAAFHLQV